jgi:phosphatidylinositol glycan class C protein
MSRSAQSSGEALDSPVTDTVAANGSSATDHQAPQQHHPRVRAVRRALQLSRARGQTPPPGDEFALPSTPGNSGSEGEEPLHARNALAGEVDASAPVKPAWRRILYEPQPYPDNYTDVSFLSSLVMNANVRPLSYSSLCLASCTITQRICLVVLWLACFHSMQTHTVRVHTVLAVDAAALLIGLAAMAAMQAAESRQRTTATAWMRSALSRALRLLLLTLLLLFVSPLLLTLTQAYSSDTIWALSLALGALHVLVFDYRWVNAAASHRHHKHAHAPPHSSGKPPEFQGALSLNAGIFAAILLGSRFQETSDSSSSDSSSAPLRCFAFVLSSFLVFGGTSVLSVWARRYAAGLHAALTALFVALASLALAWLSQPQVCSEPLPLLLLPLLLSVCVCVTFVAPAWLKSSQKYKHEIQGPWDYDDAAEMESDNL